MAGRRSVRAAVARDLRALGPGISGSAEAVAALKVAALLDDGAEPPQVPNLTRELRLLMAAVRSAVPAPDADDPMEELRALAADIP